MAIDEEKRSARWLRNKQALRERARIKPLLIDPLFEARVLQERDRRISKEYQGIGFFPNRNFLMGESADRAFAFAADVWAAETLLEAEWGTGNATPTRIRDKLTAMDRTHDYTQGSLRKMIYIALQRVRQLETTVDPCDTVEMIWPAFDFTEAVYDRD